MLARYCRSGSADAALLEPVRRLEGHQQVIGLGFLDKANHPAGLVQPRQAQFRRLR